jgi:hypothetical protein
MLDFQKLGIENVVIGLTNEGLRSKIMRRMSRRLFASQPTSLNI